VFKTGRHVWGNPQAGILDRDWGNVSYFGAYRRELERGPGIPKRWAYHAYYEGPARTSPPMFIDESDFRPLDRLISETAGPVWLTEQNGIIRRPGGANKTELTQNRDLQALLLGANSRPRVTRFYLYQWRGDTIWDSALVFERTNYPSATGRPDECLRPAYFTLRAQTNPTLDLPAGVPGERGPLPACAASTDPMAP
jgi:hypothetical protein